MVCVYCEHETKVTNSRHQKKANSVWRRRQCLNCGAVFTSIERFDPSKTIVVQNKNFLEPFSRDKLLLSVYDSLKHRKTALLDATELTDTICNRIYAHASNAAITRADIVSVTSVALRRFDKSASVAYLAFHKL